MSTTEPPPPTPETDAPPTPESPAAATALDASDDGTGAGAGTGSAESSPARRRRDFTPLWFALPIVVAAFVSFQRRWTPIGDLALVDLKLRDLWSHPPLVGAYSRFGWSHPGPAMFWLMWLPWKVVGGGARGLLFATLLWHAVGSALSLWLARRCGGRRLMIATALVLASTSVVSQLDALVQPWNPFLNLTLVPGLIAAFVLACRSDRVGWLWFVVVGSLMAQNHLGLLPPVLALGGVAVIVSLWQLWRDRVDRGLARDRARTLAMAIGLSVLVWLAPIFEQLRHSPGNLTKLWEFATDPKDKLGVIGAARILGRMLGPTPMWLGIRPPLTEFVGGIDSNVGGVRTWPILAVIPIAAMIVAAVRHDRRSLAVLGANALVIATGFSSMAGLSGLAHESLVAWVSLACALWVVHGLGTLVAAAVGHRISERTTVRTRDRITTAVVVLAGIGLAASTVVAPNPYRHIEPAARALDRQLVAALGRAPRSVDFVKITDLDADSVLSFLVSSAEQRGWTVWVPGDLADNGFDGRRVSPRRPSDRAKLVLAAGLAGHRLLDDPTLRRIAYYQPYSPKHRKRIWQLAAQVEAFEQQPSLTKEQNLAKFYAQLELSKLRGDKADISIFEQR